MSVVGWYAHHVGAGHVTRAMAVAAQMRTPVVVLSSADRPHGWPEDRWVVLPPDDGPGGRDHSAGGALHWAPLEHHGYSERMALLATWLRDTRPALVVSDVSTEVTVLSRTLGHRVAAVVMAGDRADRAHQLAYDAASALVACWPADARPVQGWRGRWDAKTSWVGGFSRFDGCSVDPPPGDRRAMWLWGGGGAPLSADRVAAVAEATPGWTWLGGPMLPPEQVWETLQDVDVVVTHGGQNAVAEVATARRRAVVLAQPRPHDEQIHLAGALARMGLTIPVTDARDLDWPALLEAAAPAAPRRWARWCDGHGATRMAAVLDGLARRADAA